MGSLAPFRMVLCLTSSTGRLHTHPRACSAGVLAGCAALQHCITPIAAPHPAARQGHTAGTTHLVTPALSVSTSLPPVRVSVKGPLPGANTSLLHSTEPVLLLDTIRRPLVWMLSVQACVTLPAAPACHSKVPFLRGKSAQARQQQRCQHTCMRCSLCSMAYVCSQAPSTVCSQAPGWSWVTRRAQPWPAAHSAPPPVCQRDAAVAMQQQRGTAVWRHQLVPASTHVAEKAGKAVGAVRHQRTNNCGVGRQDG